VSTVHIPHPSTRGLANELPLVLAISLAAAVLVWFDGPLLMRLPIGLIAALLLPGYSLQAALLRGGGGLGIVEQIALGFGMSLAIIAIVTLGLNYTPWGVSPMPLVLVLTAWTCLATAVACWQRLRSPASGRAESYGTPHGAPGAIWAALVVGTVTLLVVAVSIAFTVLASPPRLTEFFVLGRPGLAEGYPSEAQPGVPLTVTVGITNREDAVTKYRVTLEADTGLVVATEPVELAPGETWYGPVTFALPRPDKNQEIRILLHKDDAVNAYRQLSLWLDGGAKDGS